MKSPAPLFGFLFVLLIAALCVAGCTTVSPGNQPSPPDPARCGITSCHGLDLACGPNAPEVCTMEYRLGDKCRQYARCDTSGGSCTLVTEPEFEVCKACVEQCEIYSDPSKAFECEAKC